MRMRETGEMVRSWATPARMATVAILGAIQLGVVAHAADLAMHKAGPTSATVGATVTFTLSPTNVGSLPLPNGIITTVSDQVPSQFGQVTLVSYGNWTCSVNSSQLITCTRTQAISGGQPFPTIVYTAVVQSTGGYTNCADISFVANPAVQPDLVPSNNTGCKQGKVTGGKGGTLDVDKKIVVQGSIPPPNNSVFQANVDCLPGGPNVTLPLDSANSYHNTATGITPGSGCTVSEQAPVVPLDYARKGCHWETSYPNGQNFQIGDRPRNQANIVNVWSCKGNDGGKGTLDVTKKVEVIGSIPPPSPSVFMADVACLPGGPNVTLSLNNANSYHNTATGIATGANCTVTEQAPVVPPAYARRGCHWETSYPNGETFRIGDVRRNQANIVNVWSCKGNDGGKGTLDVTKKVEVVGSIPPPSPSVFMADVACLPGGPNVTLSLDSANSFHNTATGIATGANCTVTEQAPVVSSDYARKGCHWETTYPNGETFRIGDMRRNQANIVNVWSCKGNGGGNGSLDVKKRVEVVGSIPPPSPSVFLANVACQPGGPNVTLELSAENGYQNTATGIATGANCIVTEQAPVVPSDYARKGCHWETMYPNGETFRIGDMRRNQADIVNRWTCKGDKGDKGDKYDKGNFPRVK